MNWFSKKEESILSIKWNSLESVEALERLKEESKSKNIAIFKHSTRCSISSMAKNKLERDWNLSEEEVKIYYLDLIQFRTVSNAIAELFLVEHQSPQLLLLKNGKVVYHTSHSAISVSELKQQI